MLLFIVSFCVLALLLLGLFTLIKNVQWTASTFKTVASVLGLLIVSAVIMFVFVQLF